MRFLQAVREAGQLTPETFTLVFPIVRHVLHATQVGLHVALKPLLSHSTLTGKFEFSPEYAPSPDAVGSRCGNMPPPLTPLAPAAGI